jgi:hypothetical protein
MELVILYIAVVCVFCFVNCSSSVRSLLFVKRSVSSQFAEAFKEGLRHATKQKNKKRDISLLLIFNIFPLLIYRLSPSHLKLEAEKREVEYKIESFLLRE